MIIKNEFFLSSRYLCRICNDTLEDPRQCSKCKQKFCLKCINSNSDNVYKYLCEDNCFKNVEKCNKNYENLLKIIIESSKVAKNSSKKDSPNKLQNNDFKSTKCYWCKKNFTRKEMKLHQDKCIRKYDECEYCHKIIKIRNKIEHLNNCEDYVLLNKCKSSTEFFHNINEIKPFCFYCETKIQSILKIKVCKKCSSIVCENCTSLCENCNDSFCLNCFKQEKTSNYYWYLQIYKKKLCQKCLENKCIICNKFPVNLNNKLNENCYFCRGKCICINCIKQCMYCDRKICEGCSNYCYICKKHYCQKQNGNFIQGRLRKIVNNIFCLHSNNCI